MDYLKKIILDARQATSAEFSKDMEKFLETHNQVDPFKAFAKILGSLQNQNVKILYQVLYQLSQDGYLTLPETDESYDE